LNKYLPVFKNKDITLSCIFKKIFENEFVILVVYVEDVRIIRTPEKLIKSNCLKKEFEMKYIRG